MILGWLLVSCICSFNFSYFDSLPKKVTDSGDLLDSVVQTREILETLAGEPRLVATFPSGGEVFLLAPQDEAVVPDPWVDVIGTAPAETVVTLNDEIAVAGTDGIFFARVPLEQGLNEIQCVASDLEGNEVAFAFLVVFEPEEGYVIRQRGDII
jgi:hypothetical protein